MFFVRTMRKPQAQSPYGQPLRYAGVDREPMQPAQRSAMPAAGAEPASHTFPAGFDAENFAIQAKHNFIRLQDAHDRGDADSLRDMMAPALFQEIEAQLRERGGAPQKTEVVTLNAQVIDVAMERGSYVASVHFSGTIKEDPASQPASFSEIWHLEKPLNGKTGWLMTGIQQN
jgi:predicted lipid-binding transport protein (Tim44 family)